MHFCWSFCWIPSSHHFPVAHGHAPVVVLLHPRERLEDARSVPGPAQSQRRPVDYPLVMTHIAIENGLKKGEFSNSKWWFSVVMWNYQGVPWKLDSGSLGSWPSSARIWGTSTAVNGYISVILWWWPADRKWTWSFGPNHLVTHGYQGGAPVR